MPASDPATILLAHDRWATRAIIDRCRALSDEQFHHAFEMGVGSLHGTLAHMLGALEGWGHLLAGREPGERLETKGPFSCDRLAELLEELSDDFAAHAPPAMDPAEVVSGERGGKTWSFTRGAVLTHVTTHGMHHRAQCVNMLRQLGDEGPWKVSVIEWVLSGEPA
jgi:uncharacterized damage-inducible protein DinB